MLGTFGGALEARKVNASEGRLVADIRGEIESDGGVLVIRRVIVKFKLRAGPEVREIVERAHSIYAEKCPVYKTLRPAMEISSSFEMV
jgi:uncharacterized OsmC-like protein